ncbi:hypothetical protein pb186bvf_004356 [Paramecium bursaria]
MQTQRNLLKFQYNLVISIILSIYYALHQLDSPNAIVQFTLSQIIILVTLRMNANEDKPNTLQQQMMTLSKPLSLKQEGPLVEEPLSSQSESAQNSTERFIADVRNFDKITSIMQEGLAIVNLQEFTDEQGTNQDVSIEYKNKALLDMLGCENDSDILKFITITECQTFSDEPIQMRNSQKSYQSFTRGQCRFKSIGHNPMILNQPQNQQYQQQQRKSNISLMSQIMSVDFNLKYQLNTPLSGRSRSISSGHTTILKTIIYLWKTNRTRYIINETVDAIILEAKITRKGIESLIELYITSGVCNTVIIVTRDITHRDNIQKLNEINKSKAKTLSFVSHEYRTPLNCIISMLEEVLQQQIIPQNILHNIKVALENSQFLLNLSNDLLDLAQIKNNSFTVNKNTFDIVELCNQASEMFQIQAKQKNIQIKVEANVNRLFINTDKNRVKQIFMNLLGNALKFTQQGQISLKIIQRYKNIYMGVQDTGIGISEIDQKKLFQAFSKINSEESRKLNSQGVGLGLLISDQIARQLSPNNQGIQIESKPQEGTYFYFMIQVDDFHSNQKIQSQQIKRTVSDTPTSEKLIEYSYTHSKDLKRVDSVIDDENCLHILIVDDNSYNLMVLQALLKKLNIEESDTAASGEQAIEMSSNLRCSQHCQGYTLILMDIEMPFMSGIECAKIILQKNPQKAIIACSGYDDQATKDECYKQGFQGYLVKPINLQKLKECIAKYL